MVWGDLYFFFSLNKFKTLLERATILALLLQFLEPFMQSMDFNNHVVFSVSSQPQGGRKTTQLTNNGYNQPLPCHKISTLKVLPPKRNKSLNN